MASLSSFMQTPTSHCTLSTARECLLSPFGLDERDLHTTFGHLLTHAVEDADLYFELSKNESWHLEEGMVKSGSFSIHQGVGVRAISGEKTAFAYSDDISIQALHQAAHATRSIGSIGQNGVAINIAAMYPADNPLRSSRYLPDEPMHSLDANSKVALLEKVERCARAKDPRIIQVMAGLAAHHAVVLIARSNGMMAADIRPLVRLSITVIAQQNGRREMGNSGGGGRYGYDYFDDALIEQYVQDAVSSALVNLEAKPAPAGLMTVVLGPGWPGILLHEAIGHGLEGDFNRKGSSAFAGRLGERVAAQGVTVVDDGTLPNRRGSLNIDDEGTPTQCTTLIENGILKGYMQDTLNARLMKMPTTGNGRRESFAHLPMPRMTNTYMLAGQAAPEDIIASVQHGLYAVNFGGGQVDITNGKFVFSASQAYMIENGKITYPVKGATLIGHGPEVLSRVSMIGNDLRLDTGIGVCGKEGQSVPVGVGQPTLRLNDITVGGTLS